MFVCDYSCWHVVVVVVVVIWEMLPHSVRCAVAYRSWPGLVQRRTVLSAAVRTEVGSRSHHKRTAWEFIWKRTETTSSTRSRPLVCFTSGAHPSTPAAFPSAQTNRAKRRKHTQVYFNLTKQANVKVLFKSTVYIQITADAPGTSHNSKWALLTFSPLDNN